MAENRCTIGYALRARITPSATKPTMKLLTDIVPTPGKFMVAFAKNGGTGSDKTSINHWPSLICAIQNGTLVNGLLMKQAAIAKGTFTLTRIARIAATIDCGIIGTIEKNSPMARPDATVSRHGTHRLRWNNGFEIFCHHGRWRSFGWRKARNARRTILR